MKGFMERIFSGWENVRKVWRQEYKNIFYDQGVVLIFFVAFILYPVFYPLPYLNETLRDVPVAVVDLDNTQSSRQLSRMMDAHELLKVVAKPVSLEEAKTEFYNGRVYGIVLIPEDFDRRIVRGGLSNIVVYCDASYFLVYRQVLTGTKYVAGTMAAGVQIRKLMAGGLTKTAAMAAQDPLRIISYPLFNPGGGYATFVVPAVLILILQQTLLIGIGMLLGTAKENQSLHYVFPYKERSGVVTILLGKAGAYFSIYIIHIFYFFGILFRVYNLPQRAGWHILIFFAVPFLFSCIFMGLSICAVFRERESSMIFLLCTSIPILFLSGFSWPSHALPEWLHIISYLLPSTSGVDGFLKINQMGASLKHVAPDLCILWGLTFLYFILAYFSMRHILRKSKGWKFKG